VIKGKKPVTIYELKVYDTIRTIIIPYDCDVHRGGSRALVRGGGASYNLTKSYNKKKKTTIFTTQIQVVYF
jgi:hypothetical protein